MRAGAVFRPWLFRGPVVMRARADNFFETDSLFVLTW